MKRLYILSLAILSVIPSFSNRIVSYAREGQNVTLDLKWGPQNYGEVSWETSDDGGTTWKKIDKADSPTFIFKASKPESLYRAVVKGDPSCPPVIEERMVKTVSFNSDVISSNYNSAVIELSKLDMKDAKIVEYGYTSMLQGLGRTFSIIPRTKMGDQLPSSDKISLNITGLNPNTNYSVRPYFKTEDGSIIFGGGKLVKTVPGICFSSEDWIIEKTSVKIPVLIPGYSGADPKVEIWFGTDLNNLKKYNVTSSGNNKYFSEEIKNLTPGTKYVAVAKATVDGEELSISKDVKTWSDYSTFKVDNTVKPVSHIVEWDKSNMVCLTPETLQVEYPRMCRVDENKILLTYHGGVSDHWQNSYLRKSYDNGRTWTDPVDIYTIASPILESSYWRICNPEMTRLQNGWIILTVVANGNPDTNPNSKVLACISKDGGETWGNPIIVGRGRTWEPMVVQLPNGELELLVSSEAAWWEKGGQINQEILSTRSTDNGETWTTYKRASYKPGARDGMPVAIVMQGNKGVCFIEESVNGNCSPSIVHRDLDGEWDTKDWDEKDDKDRWATGLNRHAGAPYAIQLPTGEFLVMAHTNQVGSVWQTNRPQVMMADNTCHDFKYSRLPLSGSVLPSETGAYYNSFFLYDNDTVWLLFTKAQYKGDRRVESDVMVIEGKIVEK